MEQLRRRRVNKVILIVAGSILGLFVVLAAISAALGGGKNGTKPAAAASSPAPVVTSATPPAPQASASSKPVADAKSSTLPPPAAPVDSPTGFGALSSTWDAHHTADSSYNAGSAFDPDPNLPQANGRTGDRYVTVQYTAGYVTSFQVNEPSGTSESAAMANIVGKDMPADAKVLWTRDQSSNGCFQEEVSSQSLGRALAAAGVGDAQGAVLLEAQSQDISVFDASNVAWVMVNTGDGSLTAADAPGC